MLIAAAALTSYSACLFTCSMAEQDRRYVIAVKKDEAQYAVAKFLFQRHPDGELKGSAFSCTHDTATNALGKCSVVETYAYPADFGALVEFHHDFFVDAVRRIQTKFLKRHRDFVAARRHHLEGTGDHGSSGGEHAHHQHRAPEPASRGLAVWRARSQVGDGKVVQKPVFFVWQTLEGTVQITYREEPEQRVDVDDEVHTSEEAIFYVGPRGQWLFAVFSHRVGSVMHANRLDLVRPFNRSEFEPLRVTVINGGTRQYLPVVQRLSGWKIPYTSERQRSVLQPAIKARSPYLPLAAHLVDTGFRFLGDQEWLVVSNGDAKEHLRFELPYQP